MSNFNTTKGNIFSAVTLKTTEEEFITLLNAKGVKIERIVSNGQATPEGEWYDQAQDEWVLLLQGEAKILVDGDDEPMNLQAGDYLLLPAHCRHRVTWTDPDRPTVWLAVHFGALR